MNYTTEQIEQLATLNPLHQAAIAPLLDFYKHIRQIWQACEVARLRDQFNLDLRRRADRLALAHHAALVELKHQRSLRGAKEQPALKPAPLTADEYFLKLRQWENFSRLLLLGRILAPGKELNGTEHSPAMRILGSPTTAGSLKEQRKELLKRHHPDVSPFPEEDARLRFAFLKQLTDAAVKDWESLRPDRPIDPIQYRKRMDWHPPNGWTVKSFRYWE